MTLYQDAASDGSKAMPRLGCRLAVLSVVLGGLLAYWVIFVWAASFELGGRLTTMRQLRSPSPNWLRYAERSRDSAYAPVNLASPQRW